LRAGQAVVRRRDVNQRYPDSRWRLVQVADLYFQRLIGQSCPARSDQCAGGKQNPEQITPPMQSPESSGGSIALHHFIPRRYVIQLWRSRPMPAFHFVFH
jgi:hypothetical protein